ncbi:MAG: MBL fold metallo-hydrolase RNA specificity domain-containing protein [Erysipelotrichaceae bacterium]
MDLVKQFKTFKARDKLQFGNIEVTPYFIDHSAFDAYMFLIEAEGKRILHTGDFRTHGLRGSKLIKMLESYVGQVDVLITEGTMLSRDDENVMTEHQLQLVARKLMAKHKYVFILCSSTNIDRIFSFIHANDNKRIFICDDYQKEILELIKSESSKYSDFYNYDKIYSYSKNLDKLMEQSGFCMLIRSSDYFAKFLAKYQDDAVIIYSMWKGYLSGPKENQNFVKFLAPYQYEYLHTSGHATKAAIKAVCDTVKPTAAVIPIHTENPEALKKLCVDYNVKVLNDGEEYLL